MTKVDVILLGVIVVIVLMSLLLSILYVRAENNEFTKNSKTITATIYYRAIHERDIMWNYIRVKFLKKEKQELLRLKYCFEANNQTYGIIKSLDLDKEENKALIKHIFTNDYLNVNYLIKKNKVVSRINKSEYLFPK